MQSICTGKNIFDYNINISDFHGFMTCRRSKKRQASRLTAPQKAFAINSAFLKPRKIQMTVVTRISSNVHAFSKGRVSRLE